MQTEKYLVIKYREEFFTKEVKMNYNELRQAIDSEFPNSSYFIMSDSLLYQVSKGYEKIFSKGNRYLDVDVALFYLHDKYPDFFNEYKKLTDNFEYILYDDMLYGHADIEKYRQNIEDLKTYIPNKPIVVDKWKYKLKYHDLRKAINTDPTPNKKYANWVCRLVYNYVFNFDEDRDKLNQLLFDFDNPQVKAYIKASGHSININDYEKDNELFQVINECYYKKLEEIEAGNRELLKEKRKIYENDDWIVVRPKSHEEAVTLGRGTYWCTSADSEDGKDKFIEYTRNDARDNNFYDLLIFINKNDNTKKYQLSTLTEDFLDWNDEKFDFESIFNLETIVYIQDWLLLNNYICSNFLEFLSSQGIIFEESFFTLIETISKDYGINSYNSIDVQILNKFDLENHEQIEYSFNTQKLILLKEQFDDLIIKHVDPLKLFTICDAFYGNENYINFWKYNKNLNIEVINNFINKINIAASWSNLFSYNNKIENYYFCFYSGNLNLIISLLENLSELISNSKKDVTKNNHQLIHNLNILHNIFDEINILNLIENCSQELKEKFYNYLCKLYYKPEFFYQLNDNHLNYILIDNGYALDKFSEHENELIRLATVYKGFPNRNPKFYESSELVTHEISKLLDNVDDGYLKPVNNFYDITVYE